MPALLASQNEDVAELIRFLRESRKVHLPAILELCKPVNYFALYYTMNTRLTNQYSENSTSKSFTSDSRALNVS